MSSDCKPYKSEVGIHYLGHSSFVLSFDNGVDIVTDYGKENAWLEWGWDSPIHSIGDLIPKVMTYSHTHCDHYDQNRSSYLISREHRLYHFQFSWEQKVHSSV